MFVVQENSLNESQSQAELLCRQSMAKAGFAYGNIPATFHWSQLVNPLGDKAAAVTAYDELLIQEPDNKSALEGLAFIYQTLGNQDQALYYRKTLREIEARDIGVDITVHPEALSYLLAKTGEVPQPDRVPAVYVAAHFDRYSDIFDNVLCEHLEYKGHLLVKDECERVLLSDESKGERTALDIGCGTGLAGNAIRDLFSVIDGVDLSEKMLEIARKRHIYAQLHKADYHEYLALATTKYDVITASDVLIYEGDLSNTFKLVAASLKTAGHFIFTLEKGYTETFCLRNTGRFQHNLNYIRDVAKEEGFCIETATDVVLRINEGKSVNGYLFTLKKN